MMMNLSKKLFFLAATYGFMIMLLSCNQKPTNEGTVISSTVKKPEWLKGPIVSKGSNQEPLIFQVRRVEYLFILKRNIYKHTVPGMLKR